MRDVEEKRFCRSGCGPVGPAAALGVVRRGDRPACYARPSMLRDP
jgi:hypothetical protein